MTLPATAGSAAAPPRLRGYFGIGVERVSKPMNVGNLFRTAHAFGASFVFTIAAAYSVRAARSDTSLAPKHLPFYRFDSVESMQLPAGCQLVGIEITEDAVALPTFHHPLSAAYVLGPERGSLSPALLARCTRVVRIPTAFSLNVATAGAVVLYDRLLTMGRFGERPLGSQGETAAPPAHVHGRPISRRKRTGAP
ncbi:MAG: RNA methyltransferase [Alphaproteobacteria bacterium]|nr:RNA methyltransferase [Alphaproteobacteria bacterium]